MRWEESELIIILSTRRAHLQIDGSCDFCGGGIPKGSKVLSAGVADRLERRARRMYACPSCEELISYPDPEDAPPHVQEYLFENRMSREIWDHRE